MKTHGDQLIVDAKARLYDLQQILNGGYFVYRHIVNSVQLKGDEVLDIGCGTGTVLHKLHARYPGAKLHGIDPSADMVDLAKEKGGDIDFRVGFAQELEFSDQSLDLVISSLTTHHIPTETRRLMFQEIKRVLKPGGYLYLIDFHPPATLWGRIALRLFLMRHAYIRELVQLPNERLLVEEGFVIESAVAQQPFGIAQHILARPV